MGEYKARQDSGEGMLWEVKEPQLQFMCPALLIGKLGPRASWDALWEKLEHYLRQLR